MMTRDPVYYLARGRSLAAIEAGQAAQAEHYAAVAAIFKTHGLGDWPRRCWILNGEGAVCGLVIARGEDVPAVLRRERSMPDYCVPNRRTVAGRALDDALGRAPFLTVEDVHRQLCGEPQALMEAGRMGFLIHRFGVERSGDDWILSCPEGSHVPFDAEPLLRSEYWARREAAHRAASDAAEARGVAEHYP